MENKYILNYDLKTRLSTDIKFKQGDIDTSILEVTIFEGGVATDITEEVIEFRFMKPDHTIVYQDITSGVTIKDATNGVVTCILKSNTVAASGLVKCEIHRAKDGKELTTPAFNFIVENSIGADGLLSTNYISSIENKLLEMNSLITQFNNTNVVDLQNQINENVSQLAEKTTEINALETNKADKTEVNSLATEKADQVALNAEKSRIDNLVANAGVANNAEVLDIRVDSQGNTFKTSSNRISNTEKFLRTGITELKFADWEVGGMSGINGTPDAPGVTNRIRTAVYHTLSKGEKLTVNPSVGYKISVFAYDNSFTFKKILTNLTVLTDIVVVYPYYKFQIGKIDDTATSLSVADNVTITITDGVLNDGNNLNIGSIGNTQLKTKSVSTDKCTFLVKNTINLIDKTKITQDYLLDYQGLPILKSSSNAGVTDFIHVEAGENYKYKRVNNGTVYDGILNGYALFDEHKKFVSLTVTSSGIDSLPISANGYIRIYFNSGYAYQYFTDECIFCKVSDFTGVYKGYVDETYLTDDIKIKKSNLSNSSDNLSITRWGDSLTANASATNLATITGKTVYKLGAGGETTISIGGRMGAFPIKVQPFTIPADTSVVAVSLKDINNNQAGIMRLNSPGINPCVIDGITGTLAIVQTDGSSPTWSYTFARSIAGTSHPVTRPVKLITNSMQTRLNDIAIIWAGTNDSPQLSDINLLIDKIQSMIENIKTFNKQYIVLGLTKVPNMPDLPAINQRLAFAFGENFLELSKYLLEFGLADAGITPTSQDNTDIANNTVPTSLRSDSTHLNDAGELIVDNLINNKLRELGYIS